MRGGAAVDRDALAELLVRISEFAVCRGNQGMDLNPIAAYASGLSVRATRILLEHQVKGAAHGQLPQKRRHFKLAARKNLGAPSSRVLGLCHLSE